MEDQIDPQIQAKVEAQLQDKNRYEKLSEKVIVTSKERDEAKAHADESAKAKLAAEKERDFYKEFSVNVVKYPQAAEYQDKILEKVKSGYSPEDAMVSVLAKEGKLSQTAPNIPFAGGGSAPTNIEGPKSLEDMSIDDKFAALKEADKNGDLARALMGR